MSVLRIGSLLRLMAASIEKYLSLGLRHKTRHQLLIIPLNSSPDDPLKKLLMPFKR